MAQSIERLQGVPTLLTKERENASCQLKSLRRDVLESLDLLFMHR